MPGTCALAHPDSGRSVNPISTRGDRLCPPNYYWHTRIFRPSYGPERPDTEQEEKSEHQNMSVTVSNKKF